MRLTSGQRILAAVVGLLLPLILAGAASDQRLTVYTAQKSYSLPVLDHEGKAYISVNDLLTPLGASPAQAKAKEWRMQLNNAEARFAEGKDKAVIRGAEVSLDGKVLVEQQRVLVPLAAALPLLTRLLNASVDFHEPARRIFVGNALTRLSASFNRGNTPSLVLNFSQPVHPDGERSEEHGALFTHTNRTRLIFKREPLVSEVNKQQFGDGAIQSLAFTEENGTASLTVTGNAHLSIIRSGDGRTITLQPATAAASASPTPEATASGGADNQRRTQEFFVMIDPSHGGYDKGAAFTNKLLEKDVTLKLARELRKELEERGIPSRMLRDSDVDVPLERRAEITNEQRAAVYIALHAGRPGHGVRVYTGLLTNPQPPAGRFLSWDSAQSASLEKSKVAGNAVAAELRKNRFSVATLGIPIRPLNNIAVPAIAVELAPEGAELQSLESGKRNAGIAAAIASAIAQVRGQMGARP